MRAFSSASNLHLLFSILSLPSAILASGTYDCNHIRVDGQSFDLSSLRGPRSVVWSQSQPPRVINTTFTLDICKPLKRTKGVAKGDECRSGTRVCGIRHTYNADEDTDVITDVIHIAGDYIQYSGRSLDAEWTRLRSSASNSDSEKEGLRGELHGGVYPFGGPAKDQRKQKAVIEFLCDRDRTGLEGLGDAAAPDGDDGEDEDEDEVDRRRSVMLLADDGETVDDGKSLKFVRYGPASDDSTEDVLRLEWRTKYACEGQKEKDDSEKGNHWGFFTWFLIIFFMGTATYLIFGSWLNYNRYGARGWDLLPHGDTIRDLPYLLRDWSRNVFSTLQGHGSRGGYSAV